jgi:hypothetical protein
MSVQEGKDVPANVKRMISSKQTMLLAYFSPTGFVSTEFLPERQKYNSQFFTETILPSLVTRLSVPRPKLKATAAHLHLAKAKPHNSRLSIEKMEEYEFILKFDQARWIPHQLSGQQKADRTTLSRDMFQMIRGLGPTQRNYLIRGDETWIF